MADATNTEQELIKKMPVRCNLTDYERMRREFNWENLRSEFNGFAGDRVNMAYECIDRHCDTGRRNKVAMYWVGGDAPHFDIKLFTFNDMRKLSNRFANLLHNLGVKQGDRVFFFLPRIPTLYYGILGSFKVGAIAGPLFAAFGPEAVRDRLQDSGAVMLVTTPELYKKVESVRNELKDLRHVVFVGDNAPSGAGNLRLNDELDKCSDEFRVRELDWEAPMLMHYTSGTTGKPKGIVHVHKAMYGHLATGRWVLDLREEDVYWCTADPGWVTGTSYGIFAPWLNGASQVVYEGRFAAENWYSVIDQLGVTIWYTAPTALRMLMKAGDALVKQHKFRELRHILSVGEPLNAEVVRWGMKVYGLPIHDTWWMTETGAMMIVNFPCTAVKPGSMGKPMPGVHAAIIDGDGNELPPGKEGFLALRPPWPSMMREIWKNKPKFDEYFRIKGWYFSGDTAMMDQDGYFWFVGRADDVIKTSGHRVGPFEVESALVEHPAVAEAGVIGRPDPEGIRGDIIKAFVALRAGFQPSDQLKKDIAEFVRKTLASHAVPRDIEIVTSLPKTRSGKIMRRVLKARELGQDPGDVSSLED